MFSLEILLIQTKMIIYMSTMPVILLIVTILSVAFIPVAVFAQTSYDINIPTGAASPDAPYFWQNEKDGSTTGIIEVTVGDTVVWKNADTAPHTVSSGTFTTGLDGNFDSEIFPQGKSFSHTFDEIGEYPYFCKLHSWMTGSVIVASGYSIIPEVGKQVGDGSSYFDVEYDFNRLVSVSDINQEEKLITFEIIGNAKSDDHTLKILLPTSLIDGPFVVWVDNEKLSDFNHQYDDEQDLNLLTIQLDADSKSFTLIGTSIVPEFGLMAVTILGVSVVAMIGLSRKFNLQI